MYAMYGGGIVERTSAAKVTVGTHSSTQNYQLNMAGGTGIMDSGHSNHASGVAATWFSFTVANGTGRDHKTHPFDTAAKTMGSQIASFSQSGGGNSNHEVSQMDDEIGVYLDRSSGPNISGTGRVVDLNSSLNGFDANPTAFSGGHQWYGNGGRMSDSTGFIHSANGGNAGIVQFSYQAGYASVPSVAGTAGGVNQGAGPTAIYGLVSSYDWSSPGGGTSGNGVHGGSGDLDYANLGTLHKLCWLYGANTPTGGASFTDSITTIYLNVMSWNGTNGNNPTRNGSSVSQNTSGNTTFTLPSHSSSTYQPKILATTWGNVVLHGDTNDPTNDCVFPVTWSGDSATVGSSVQWPDNISANLSDCFWKGLDGVGLAGDGSKYMCGQSRAGSADIYRTFAFRNVNSNTEIDILKVDFSDNSGKHEVELLHKNIHTITGVTLSAGADADPIFMNNNTDLLLWVRGTNASDATECSLIYIENAFYGGAALGY